MTYIFLVVAILCFWILLRFWLSQVALPLTNYSQKFLINQNIVRYASMQEIEQVFFKPTSGDVTTGNQPCFFCFVGVPKDRFFHIQTIGNSEAVYIFNFKDFEQKYVLYRRYDNVIAYLEQFKGVPLKKYANERQQRVGRSKKFLIDLFDKGFRLLIASLLLTIIFTIIICLILGSFHYMIIFLAVLISVLIELVRMFINKYLYKFYLTLSKIPFLS